MRKAPIIAAVFLLTACTQKQPEPVQQPASVSRRYRVVQDGRLAGVDLKLLYDQVSSATFETRDGRRVVYHGSFYYEELPDGTND